MAKNFLLGNGEKLVEKISAPSINPDKAHPYTIEEAIERLTPEFENTIRTIKSLPAATKPDGFCIALFTLHPAYIAKSYFPFKLFDVFRLISVGSRGKYITPEKWNKKGSPIESETIELFVSGEESSFEYLLDSMENRKNVQLIEDVRKIESVKTFQPGERLIGFDNSNVISKEKKEVSCEIVAHMIPGQREKIINSLSNWFSANNSELETKRGLHAGNLLFFPAQIGVPELDKIERHSFLRVVRPMPSIRPLIPEFRNTNKKETFSIELPPLKKENEYSNVLIVDGGIDKNSLLAPYVDILDTGESSQLTSKGMFHGHAVTSALLFGPIRRNKNVPDPCCIPKIVPVIMENDSTGDDLFDVLPRVEKAITRSGAKFVNLSLGPRLPVEDTEVHTWTAVLDKIAAERQIIITVAVGNDGDLDWPSGNARVQVPSDAVNLTAVGASDTIDVNNWRRAKYSCIGPGRVNGFVKPDFVTFGGSSDEPFYVIDQHSLMAIPMIGTSFAAPNALRSIIKLANAYGSRLAVAALRALLIHSADTDGIDRKEVGWGRIPNEIEDIILCNDDSVKVLFQGTLEPGKYVRIPFPLNGVILTGKVNVKATFCYITDTDPQDTTCYTKSGIVPTFRPKKSNTTNNGSLAKSMSFFSAKKMFSTEQDLRNDLHKWETVLKQERTFYPSSLEDPVFDVHYVAREGGGATFNAKEISYALVLSLSAPKTKDLYDQVVRAYQTILLPLQPQIEIPVAAS